ncbi:MAG: sugar-transfer associated ATP-grasp domain-containing protein [Candidatus Paceibacterota bacterium]
MSKLVLGINARNYLYLRAMNRPSAIARADNKLATKQVLIDAEVATTPLIATFSSFREARSFDWETISGDFVLKPARGYGGAGITVIREWNGRLGFDPKGDHVTAVNLETEIFGILDGAHSLNNVSDEAFLEERVIVSRTLRRLAAGGVPDIRIIVYNRMPIMAMLRMPTINSHGKANLHQGALGIGIDMRTGITTRGVLFGAPVKRIPGSHTKVHGIKIPAWDRILEIAIGAHCASGLGYSGIDIVLDEKRGPLVLEINARPGLQIQLANGASLRTRLERVEGMLVPSNSYGIDLAKHMFAEHRLSHITDRRHILGVTEMVTIFGPKGSRTFRAKIDTGAYRSAIDKDIANELGLLRIKETVIIKNATGHQKRQIFSTAIRIRGHRKETSVSIADRSSLAFPMIIGRQDLQGFLIDPSLDSDIR